jgi:hypothetical protein
MAGDEKIAIQAVIPSKSRMELRRFICPSRR